MLRRARAGPFSCSAIAGTRPRPSSTPSTCWSWTARTCGGSRIEVRKATLASILRKSRPGVRLNEHLEHHCGLTVFQHACKMGLRGHRVEATGLALPIWAFARLAEVQEPGGAGGEAGGGRGLGSVTIAWRHASKAASHSRPGSRSPAFASSMIFWATASRVGADGPSACWRATRAISKATPRRRAVSGSNLWPCK